MVEFAMVLPVLILVVFGSIDYGSYFASRLSVENASRAAVRAAASDSCTGTSANNCWTAAQPPASTTIEGVAIASASDAHILNKDCPDGDGVWPPSATDLATLTPGTGCISIRYYYINGATQSLCASWSAGTGTLTPQALYPVGTDCLMPVSSTVADMVQVVVGFNFTPPTPMPFFTGAGLVTTSAASELLLEQS
jgi:Flp pilus assembly protein TadG